MKNPIIEYIEMSLNNCMYENARIVRAYAHKSIECLYGIFKYTAWTGYADTRYFVIVCKHVYTFPTESKMLAWLHKNV